jgi:hypothetical protein
MRNELAQQGAADVFAQLDLLQQFQGFDIQIVGRLVHDQQVGRLGEQAASSRRLRSPPESAEIGARARSGVNRKSCR